MKTLVLMLLLCASVAEAQPVVTKADVPEHTTRNWPIDFRDAGVLTAPSSADWYVVTYQNNVLVPVTPIVALSSHVVIQTPGLSIPTTELNQSNPNLPEMIPAALVVRATAGSGQTAEAKFWFSLQNIPPPSAMKIGIVANQYGALSESFVRREVEALAGLGHAVMVFPGWAATGPLQVAPRVPVAAGWDQASVDRFWPDVLYAEMGFLAHQRCVEIARTRNLPFVLRVWEGHDAFASPTPIFYADASADRRCLGIIVEDEWMRDYAMTTMQCDKVSITANSIDLEVFQPAPGPPEAPVILALARFVPKKGLDVLVRAAELIQAPHVVRLIGYGDEEQHLRSLAGPTVEFLPPIAPEQLPAAYRAATIFCAPGIRTKNGDADGIPTTALEAMACGLPVVCSDLLSARCYITDSVTGYFVVPGDVEFLAKALTWLVRHPRKAAAMGRAARAFAEEHLDIRRNIKVIERVLDVGAREHRWQAGQIGIEHARANRHPSRKAFYDEIISKTLAWLPIEGAVLDLGCGDGALRTRMPAAVTSYAGVDVHPHRSKPQPPWYYRGQGEALPFEGDRFDTVVSNSVLQHVLDPPACLGEAYRVLRRGGHLALQITIDRNPIFMWWFDATCATRMCEAAGFVGVKTTTLNDGQFLLLSAVKP